MAKLYNEFKDSGFVVLAINIGEKKQVVEKYVNKEKLPFPVLLDVNREAAGSYGVRAQPDHFLIDRKGELIGRALGARDWASEESRNLIRFLVEQNQEQQ